MVRRWACAASVVMGVACASLPPVVGPAPAHPIAIGINDGFHGVLPPDVFAFDCPHMIRSPQVSGAAVRAFLEASPCPMLALVEAPDVDLVQQFARENPPAIELCNECELTPAELTPPQYADWIARAVAVLSDYHGEIVLGGVYAITDATKDAITRAVAVCDRCIVGVHLYDASDEDLAWLASLNRRIWVTETGYPTRCESSREPEQAKWLQTQFARFATVPRLERVFIYQRAKGPTCSDLDTFGIAGTPAAALLH